MGACTSKIDKKQKEVDTFTIHRQIQFDLLPRELLLGRGEKEFATLEQAFDLKANQDRQGSLLLTNLRLVWSDNYDNSLNVSVWLGSILRESVQAQMNVITLREQSGDRSRYEFIFRSVSQTFDAFVKILQAALRSYSDTS